MITCKSGFFCTYISIDYLVHEITKDFFKDSHFWNMRVGFLLRCQNSLRCKISLISPLKYWVIEAKVGFWICYCHKYWSKYHLDTIQTTFSEKNNYLGTILVKTYLFHTWKWFISWVFHRSEFWYLRGKSALRFSKWLFFQNSLVISSST